MKNELQRGWAKLAMPRTEGNVATTTESRILEVAFPPEGQLRSRKVVTRSRARSTGKYPSHKMGRMIQWESEPERNAFRLLDADPLVLEFREQPAIIRYVLDGEEHLHYPDALVRTHSTRELWEVKTAKDAASEEVARRTELMCQQLPAFGYIYRMAIAEDLGREPRMSNVREILKFGRTPIPPVEREQIRQLLENATTVTWGAATTGALGPYGRQRLARLFLEGYVAFDAELAITASSLFWWVPQAPGLRSGGSR